ncbi:tRNA (guanosine(37)-N1)-methyltransferase TrmD [Pseudaquidulcibacter saccharophilus]|uniref:tRNA (guanosine(37)-N1)-methyltransferase TrmD n=1 Tax=Pseudaquidulcibacter saccharophilus TaxID=2831900 RepID=UPI001EFF4448|nr:tRNA (guanosine(37)-N1)-methyltransferase TrmD [Pseudaquidulcibacter saccharophilus]
MAFKVSVITITPEAWPGALGVSLLESARKEGVWELETIDLRDFGHGKHRQIDDTAAGGGAGMVIKPDVAVAAVNAADAKNRPIIYLTPRGKPLTQKRVRELVKGDGLVLFCGRFEGLDERAIEIANMEEICVGDVVLMGGDIAAQLLTEATVRLLDGVMGNKQSGDNESFENGLLEHPLYTRPREFMGKEIPEVLLSGNHAAIDKWKNEQSRAVTLARRPDLLKD